MSNYEELRSLALAAKGWQMNHVVPATDDAPCTVGHLDEDDNFSELLTVDCENYYGDSVPLANFIIASSPNVILEMLSEIDRLDSKSSMLTKWSESGELIERLYSAGLQQEQELAQLQTVINVKDSTIKDLVALVWRMASQLRKLKPECKMADQAVDYVNRKGLTPSPLRVEPQTLMTNPVVDQKESDTVDKTDVQFLPSDDTEGGET